MKKFKFLKPYANAGIGFITNFPESKKRSGVYIIKEDGVIVYVGYSATDLYTTMYRHFQEWNDKRGARVTYFNLLNKRVYKVRLVYCTPLQAARLEKALIIKYYPRDNKEKYDSLVMDHSIYETYDEQPVERESPF